MDLEYLKKLHQSKELQDLEWAKCKEDPYYFLVSWANTLDTHSEEENIIKPFPRRKYIKLLVDIWLNTKLLLIPKTRQMMMSWLFCALYLWDAQFHKGRLIFFQSKREDDADDLIKRSKFIWDHEPKFLKRYHDGNKFVELKCNPQNQGNHTHCKIVFPDINSEIRGIPEGGDIIRMHTASGIMEDEMAFQPEAEAALTAAKPTLSAKGRWTGISTAEDNTFFEKLVFDQLET